MMFTKSILLFAMVIFTLSAVSQNLLENSSFEDKAYCPGNFNQQEIKTVKQWWQASEGTPDYFNVCSEKVGIPDNMFGTQPAKDGDGYIGLVTYSKGSNRNYREYLQTKLTRPLTAGEMVCIEMYVSAADYCCFVTDGFGAILSKNKIAHDKNGVIAMPQSMSNPRLHMLDEASAWVRLSDVYTATGGEEYFTIGNFKQDRELKIIRRTEDMGARGNDTWGYLYVDNVSVKGIKSKSECSCENEVLASLVVDPPLELSEYNKIQLDAVLFDFDKDELTSQAIIQLEEVYKLLRKNRAMYMEISGFTDIIGPDGYNLDLSKRRASRVIEYLKTKGIDESRLTMTFYGSQLPVAPNETDEGRAQNRRVEFQILEKKFELIQ